MKVKNTLKALNCSYNKESTTFILLDFSPTLWYEVWCLIEELCGGIHPQKSKSNAKFKEMLKHKLMEYIQENSNLVAELPSCVAVHREMEHVTHNVPYFIPPEPSFTLTSSQSIANEIKVICANSIQMLQEGFQLLHNKASEILAFIITDLDKKFSATIPTYMPAAYGLKG